MIVSRRVPLHRVLWELSWPLAGILAVTLVAWLGSTVMGTRFVSISVTPLTIIGAALSLFLAFRNNAVYDRYWEGRILWGRLVNASRTLTRQLVQFVDEPGGTARAEAVVNEHLARTVMAASQQHTLNGTRLTEHLRSDGAGQNGVSVTNPDHTLGAAADYRPVGPQQDFVRNMVRRQIAYAYALRSHLREEEPWTDLERHLTPDEIAFLRRVRNVPAGILQIMGRQFWYARRRGWVSDLVAPAIDSTFTELTTIQGGCERIKNTPLPPIYTYLAHKLVLAYCFILPFGLVKELGILAFLVVSLIAIAFLTLDRISYLIETPFGLLPNDLPLSALARNIEIDLLQLSGEADREDRWGDVPPPMEPVDGVLL